MKIIGIDGGGTKTDIVLCDGSGVVLNRIRVDGTNPNDIGIELCLERLTKGISEVINDDISNIDGVFAGISGGITGNNQVFINAGLRRFLGGNVAILNNTDAICALSSGIEKGDGCVLIAGTGTIAYARKDDHITRVGGFGYLIDKGGSGFDFGRDGIYHALCAKEGRGENTIITPMIEEKTGDLLNALGDIYEKGKSYIASFAPIVFEAYKNGDSVAYRIIEANSFEMASILNAVASQFKCDIYNTVLTGSIFKEYDILQKHIAPHLKHEFNFIFPKVPPVYGAIVEIADELGVRIDNKFYSNFKESIGC